MEPNTDLLKEHKYEEYVQQMLVRNDWLQDHGKEPELEIYLINNCASRVIGIYLGVVGLPLEKIEQWLNDQILIKSGLKYDKEDNYGMHIKYSRYLYSNNIDIEHVFIEYLVDKLQLKKLEVEEFETGGTKCNFNLLEPEPEVKETELSEQQLKLQSWIREFHRMDFDRDVYRSPR